MLGGVVVDAQGVAAHCVEDAHVRVQHDSKWHKENRYSQQDCVSTVCQGLAVSQHALRCPGAPDTCRARPPPNHWRQGHTQAQHPRTCDQQFSSVWGQFVLPLHNDQETVHADNEEDGHPLQDEQPVQHDGGAAETAPKAPVCSGHGDCSEGHAEQREHDVWKGQSGKQEIDSRTHGRFLVNNQTHDCIAEETDSNHEDHYGCQGHTQSDWYERSRSFWWEAFWRFLYAVRVHAVTLLHEAFITKSHSSDYSGIKGEHFWLCLWFRGKAVLQQLRFHGTTCD